MAPFPLQSIYYCKKMKPLNSKITLGGGKVEKISPRNKNGAHAYQTLSHCS
jgi:hypothetical protein